MVGQSLHEDEDPGGRESSEKALDAYNARVVHYETLISAARAQYGEFLERSAKADRLDEILKKVQ